MKQYTHALHYLDFGWSVIPVRAEDKRPLVRWLDFQARRPTRAEVQDWLRQWPKANLAVVTGKVSGLIVLDVDPQHGGAESLRQLEREHGPLPHTVQVRTGGGGRHYYFVHPGGVLHNKVSLFIGIDVRGDGGYVVAPPSVHASGQHYEWLASNHPDHTPLAHLPAWLLQAIRNEEHRTGHPTEYWRQLVRSGVAEGERNNTIASFTGHLLWHGVDPDIVLELMLCWNAVRCRPPLSDNEVAQTVASITRLHTRRMEDEIPP
jgi:hypothetical protein